MKKLFVFAILALMTVTAVDAQRYRNRWERDRFLADVPAFVFSVGNGLATDTANLSATAEYDPVMWDGENTFEVSNLNVAIQSGIGDDTLGVHVCWSDTINDATPNYLNTTALAVDSTNASGPGGLDDATFDDATIPSGQYVWLRLTNITTSQKPTQVVVTVTGHMQDDNGN